MLKINSVEGAALIIAASVSLTRPLLILMGQKFSELTSGFTNSMGFSRETNRQNPKSSQRSNGIAPDEFPRKGPSQSDDHILLQDV